MKNIKALLILGFCNFLIWFILLLLYNFLRLYVYEFGGTLKFFLIWGFIFILPLFAANVTWLNKIRNAFNGGNSLKIYVPVLSYTIGALWIIIDMHIGGFMSIIIRLGSRMHASFVHYNNSLIMLRFGIMLYIIVLLIILASCTLVLLHSIRRKKKLSK